MKRYLIAACLLMLVASTASAATKGSKELLFGFSGLNTLGANEFNGGIAIRHYISDNMAVRPGVSLGYTTDKTDGVGGFTDDKRTDTNFGLNVALEKHMGDSKTISPYMGAGVDVSMYSTKWEYTHAAAPATGTNLERTYTTTNFGVFGLVGFQWFWTENLSLGGEYQLGLGVGSNKDEYTYQAQPTTSFKGSSMGLGLGTAQLSLSVAL